MARGPDPITRLTPKQLQRWRRRQRDPVTGKRATQRQAALWFGCSIRGWQHWEMGTREIPFPLLRRIAFNDTIFPETPA